MGVTPIKYIKQLTLKENELHDEDVPLYYQQAIKSLNMQDDSGGRKDTGYYIVYAPQIIFVRQVINL